MIIGMDGMDVSVTDEDVKTTNEMPSQAETASLNHGQVVTLSGLILNELLKNDPLLSDLPVNVTLNEVTAQAAVGTGSALTVEVTRADGETLKVVVQKAGATLSTLRHALQRHIELLERRRTGRTRLVSWRYVWKRYCLQLDSSGERLTRKQDLVSLETLGIKNKSKLMFVKQLRDKQNIL